MSTQTPPRPSRPHRDPLPPAVAWTAGVLLAVPILALVIVPIYAHDGPRLGGWPFFYWYQTLWTILGSGFTYSAYLLVRRARRGGGR